MVAGTSVAETAVAGTATASAAGYGLGSPAVPQTAVADEARPKRLWVRTPIIPGMTDRPDNVRGLARFMLEATGAFGAGPALVERWELCAFNNLCSGKYRSLGRPWELEGAPLMGASELGALVGAAVAEGWPADRIRWTGMTRNES